MKCDRPNPLSCPHKVEWKLGWYGQHLLSCRYHLSQVIEALGEKATVKRVDDFW